MEQRGRKSTAALSVVAKTEIDGRPKAPADLTDGSVRYGIARFRTKPRTYSRRRHFSSYWRTIADTLQRVSGCPGRLRRRRPVEKGGTIGSTT
jgi:hypothetical protein